MKRTIVFLAALILVVSSGLSAVRAEGTWDCPTPGCGRTGNRGNYCGGCGHPAPWMVSVGEYITYGHYEQDSNKTNGKESIEWLVLAKEGGKVLLISRYGLDTRQYHDSKPYPTWEKSDIRWWLNGTFLNEAFTAEEQAGIVTTTVSTSSYYGQSGGADTQDKIWLLSREEVEKYFSSKESRKAPPTAYAVVQGAHQDSGDQSQYKVNGEGCCWWWLRSPGYYSDTASVVGRGGSLSSYEDYYVYIAYNAVRPALWLDLDLAAF